MFRGRNNFDKSLLEVILDMREVRSMRVAVDSSIKGGFIVGAAATLGGLLLGPRGIAIGGAIAGLATSYTMDGQFKSVPDIIMNELTEEQKVELAKILWDLLNEKNIYTVATLLISLQSGNSQGLIVVIKEAVSRFLLDSRGYQIV